MLRLNLSVLGRPELERLLEVARARGQEDFVRELEAEFRARAAGLTAPAPVYHVEDDEPLPMVVPDDLRPDDDDLRFEPAARRPAPKRAHFGLAAAAVLAGVVAVAAWSLGGFPRPGPSSGPPGERAPARQAAVMPPRGSPESAPVREAAQTLAPAETQKPPPRRAEARPSGSQAAGADLAAVGTAVDAVARPRRLDPCANPPTPADRALCGDLALNLLERELRDAYGRALDAGADPARLRADQAAWRAARDPVSDSRVLASLYDRRIRELRAQAVGGPSAEAPENIR